MSQYDEPCACPKCNEQCVLEVLVSQERENVCPKCGFSFVDSSAQFKSTYCGLFYESGEDDSPPVALFRSREELDKYVAYLGANAEDEDAQHTARFTVAMDCSVYGAYWNNGLEDNPYDDKFFPFIPDDLPRTVKIGTEVTARNINEAKPISMHQRFTVQEFPIYYCEDYRRWYMFVLHNSERCQVVSINNGPLDFIRAYMSGVISAMRVALLAHDEDIAPIDWETFQASGDKLEYIAPTTESETP